tara:strand:+ start:419 stop:1276 length:858 start_codon:yes stop_codon:yes gene_type:complete
MPIKVNKKYGFTASVNEGSNKIIACSKANWEPVRLGSFIMLDKDDTFYRVINKRKFIYQKDVVQLNSSQIKVAENLGTMVSIDDDLSFMYAEHSVASASVENGGEGYQVGDIITPEGGVCKYNSIDQIDVPAQIEVTEVDSDGKILSIELINGGLYSSPPADLCNGNSNLGNGVSLALSSQVSDQTSVEERTVSAIDYSSDSTVLHLNHDLPPRTQEGKIRVEKWELTIDGNYVGQSKYSSNYNIVKDFTPHNEIPLIHGDIASGHIIFNEAMAIIDQRLKDLES